MLTWHLFKNFVFSKRTGALIRTMAWISVVAIAIGLFSLILVNSVMNGFHKSINHRLLAVEPHLFIAFDGQQEEKWHEFRGDFLARNPSVSSYLHESQEVVLKTVDGGFGGAEARGLEPEALNNLLADMAENEAPDEEIGDVNFVLEPGEVLVGIDLARAKGIFEGDELTFVAPESLLLPAGEVPIYEKVTVRGFVSSKVAHIDEYVVFYERGKALQRLMGAASFKNGVEIYLENPLEYRNVEEELVAAGFQVESWKERNSTLFYSLMLEKSMISIFLALSTIIASLSLITAITILTTQKRREMGLFMAMGLSASRTRKLFSRIGLILAGLGMGSGILLGLLASILIEKYPLEILPAIYYDRTIPADVNYQFVLTVLLAAFVIGFFVSWYPVRKVSKLMPIEAIRPRN